METAKETTPPAPPASAAAESREYNPKAIIEEASKGEPETPEPPPEQPKETGKEKTPEASEPPEKENAPPGDKSKPLDKKNNAISKAKAEVRQIAADMKALEEKYNKAIEEKNAMAAEIAKFEYGQKEKELMVNSQKNFFAQAEADGVQNIESFKQNASYYIPRLKANPEIEAIIMDTPKPFAVMETLFDYMASKGISSEALTKQETPTLRKWISEIYEGIVKSCETAAPPENPAPPPSQPKKEPPKSVVASVGKNGGEEVSLNTATATMDDIIRHVRKYGGTGIK